MNEQDNEENNQATTGSTFWDFLRDILRKYPLYLIILASVGLTSLVWWAHINTSPGDFVTVLGVELYRKSDSDQISSDDPGGNNSNSNDQTSPSNSKNSLVYVEDWESLDSPHVSHWRGNTTRTDVDVVREGGNPGGFLRSYGEGFNTWDIGIVSDEPKIIGNYRSKGINKISFDIALMQGNFDRAYFRVRYKDSRYNGWIIPIRINTNTKDWQEFSIMFDSSWSDSEAKAAGWVQEESSASFGKTISNVYNPEIRLSGEGYLEAGFDNVRFYK